MLRVGIVTLYNNNYNYGGQLQAYAMQILFTTNGSEAKLVSFSYSQRAYILKRLVDIGISKFIYSILNKIAFKIKLKNKSFREKFLLKKEKFDDFISSIAHTDHYVESTIKECNNEFDLFVCGSDQIWNPGWWNDILFLSFSNKPKFSYAASIAREHLSKNELSYLENRTFDFKKISVREISAKELFQENFSRNVELVLDPTLMIDKKIWDNLAIKPDFSDKYVLVYLLGDSVSNKERIYKKCKQDGFKVVMIGYSKNTYKSNEENNADIIVSNAGPKEWLGLIKNASAIITDSFHGTIFSIIFEKIFFCIEKGKGNSKYSENSRLVSLLSLSGLESRLLTDIWQINFDEKIDFNKAWHLLNIHKKNSQQFIDDIIQNFNKYIND